MGTAVGLALAAASAWAQDQQLGARTKAMGGSYTAFEDDPVSVWLNPAGIASQPDGGALVYQTYTTYPLQSEKVVGGVEFEAEAEPNFNDPALIPSYIGLVFQLGESESPAAVGVCYAAPYRLNYSFDRIADPFQRQYVPDSNLDQSFARFRVAAAKDFRLRPAGEPGFFTHLAVGAGLDVGLHRWEFRSAAGDATERDTAFGFGLGTLLGVYDDGGSFRANLGAAYQSGVSWDFNVDPEIFPAFDMPQQLNFGLTLYLLKDTPLRVTFDFQWLDWSETAEEPRFAGRESFEDAVNFSMGLEYRIRLSPTVQIYPRIGYRRFDAPWGDADDLPMTSDYQLVLDTDGEAFDLLTLGLGVGWSTGAGKLRSIDLGADFGGDAPNLAVGLTYEF